MTLMQQPFSGSYILLAYYRLAEVDDEAHDDDEGRVYLCCKGKQLAVSTLYLNSGYGNGDALDGDHLAGTGTGSVSGSNPGLCCRRSADRLCGFSLQLAEEHAA